MNTQLQFQTTIPMMECPICMDDINPTRNCIVTECNHTFHASCMLKSIVHGNFDCPCCRFELAESPEEENEDDEDEYNEDNEEEDEYELYVGFRALFVRAEGNEYVEEDDEFEGELNIPLNYFVNKLKSLNYTYEDLVKVMADDACYKSELDERSNGLIEKVQELADNYQPGDEAQPELETEVKPVVAVTRFRNTIDLCGNN
uniref:RING-type domain-containing protein n=1 Tax=viral metagenome TaxID=1070528 RepID=A0A6C0IKB7_9ZZZZ